MKIFLLRHSETAGSLLGQYIGRTDPPLCTQGVERAEDVAKRPDVERVYVTTLLRTAQTGRILYPRAELLPRSGLREMDFGAFEGKSWRDLETDGDYRAWLESECESPCPGGENKADFIKRCTAAFLEIVEREHAQSAEEVHFVVHCGTIMAVMSALARPLREYFSWGTKFCGGYALEYAPWEDSERPLRLVEAIRPGEGSETR